ncbi:MAG: FAD-dependent oxidoreductase [Oceanospirillaceae bacterium]|nr:FAD-dependent oxidoreductase [Oceanospirillaceae bacterium]MCP5335353.1 FAD-dependent oxidoreductase [Oceanospirillaceae bacterium]MCP5350694.1 FAD-dependent oxidoreductase [Oceanospirillaceae bacterium]
MKKFPIIALLILLVAAFFGFGLNDYLTLQGIKNSQAQISGLLAEHPVVIGLVFMLAYISVTALSLPGAAVMTLAAGAFFGLGWGTLIVSFASSIGATLAFIAARYFLRDSVQKRFAQRLSAINTGVENEGAFYLFTLRLVPLFPFFMINLLMGLTAMRTWTFYWVSQLGMLAGTIVYVNAGTQLANISSLSGILSLPLLLSFALLGIFPLLAKRIISIFQKQRIYKGFKKPRRFERNLIVIGAGAAGLVSAYIAAAVKAKVTLIEAHKMGGDCLNYGCVPSKALIKSAKVANLQRRADIYGLTPCEPQFNFKAVMQRVQDIIKKIEPHDSIERYTGLGVDVVQGYAKIINPWTVQISAADGTQRELTSRAIIIAAGAAPIVPDIPGLAQVGYYTSDTLWESFAQMDEVPRRIVLLGGGPIGCELAQCFARLGADVTLVERNGRVLPREDQDVSEFAAQKLQADGVTLLCEHAAVACEITDGQKILRLSAAGAETRIPFDAIICAVGRRARLTGYGLEELGIETQRTVNTNEYLQTLYPNIYAAGDVAGPYQFTHVASHQAWYAAVNALFGGFKKFKADYRVIPRTTFIDPEIARVGLNEQEAREQGIAFEITRFGIDDLDRAIADSQAEGFIKVLTVPGKDKILGVTIAAANAGELLAEYVLAMKYNLGLNKILGTIHAYPTMAEANKYVAGEWKRAHAPQQVLQWLARYHRWQRGE